jgi:hypothetical protein
MKMYLLGGKKTYFFGRLESHMMKKMQDPDPYQKVMDQEQSYKLHWSRRRDVLYPGGYKEMSI